MFEFVTPNQLVIGLNTLQPIYRLIKENKFKNILIMGMYKENKIDNTLQSIINFVKRQKIRFEFVDGLILREPIQIKDGVDLLISYGVKHVHHIAKKSNPDLITHYAIETEIGLLSSCGSGVIWHNKKSQKAKQVPNVIFNDCKHLHQWNINDSIYFLHDISLAIDAVFNQHANELIKTNGINGIIEFFKNYKIISHSINKNHVRKAWCNLAFADLLMKNAYNNTEFTPQTQNVANETFHYQQFEVAIAYESIFVFDHHLKHNIKEFDELVSFNDYSLNDLAKDFHEFYTSFSKDPHFFETTGGILGNKFTKIINTNQKTRKVC